MFLKPSLVLKLITIIAAHFSTPENMESKNINETVNDEKLATSASSQYYYETTGEKVPLDSTNTWALSDIQPGLCGIFESVKDKLNRPGIHGFPSIFEGRVYRNRQKELTDSFKYNWEYDTIYAYNNYMTSGRSLSSGLWNSHSEINDGYRRGSMFVLQRVYRPHHHEKEYQEYLKKWNEKKFKEIFEMDSISAPISGDTVHEPYCFSRLIIKNGKVVDLKIMNLRSVIWEVRRKGVFYD